MLPELSFGSAMVGSLPCFLATRRRHATHGVTVASEQSSAYSEHSVNQVPHITCMLTMPKKSSMFVLMSCPHATARPFCNCRSASIPTVFPTQSL